MNLKNLKPPKLSPALIFNLRDCSFASDLFIAAVGHLDFFSRLNKTGPLSVSNACSADVYNRRGRMLKSAGFRDSWYIRHDFKSEKSLSGQNKSECFT